MDFHSGLSWRSGCDSWTLQFGEDDEVPSARERKPQECHLNQLPNSPMKLPFTDIVTVSLDAAQGSTESRSTPVGLCLAGFLLIAATPLTHANLIGNGSFESPDVPTGSTLVSPTPTGWTSVGPNSNHLLDHPLASTGNWPNPQDGEQYAALLGGTMTGFPPFGTVDMSLATGLRQTVTIPNTGEYELSWYDNAAIGVGGTPYNVSISSVIQTFPVVVAVSSSAFSPPLGKPTWTEQSFSFTIGPGQQFTDPGSYTIEFRPTSIGVTLLDNVSLTGGGGGGGGGHTVPDSGGSLMMFGSAIASLGFLLRRQSAA